MVEPLQAGLKVGEYELVRRIGRGGMAEVWVARKASDRRAAKYVAIKVVADQYAGDPRYQRMFQAEADLSSLLNHANIVQVFDEGEDQGRSYLVMEWVDGVNLLKVEAALTFVDDEEWRFKIISYIIGQLLYALRYAHSITLHDGNPLGIVHRDVSPQNVLVSAQGEVKLTDFGVAHYVLEESSGVHVKGKVRYMSPEQISGKTRDPRLDLYAVGAILHELLDGRRFRHHVEDQREMYLEALSGKIPPLSRLVPPELDALRRALLEPEVERRVATADAALDLLAEYPGHGDARRELTQLCSALTGVKRPRVGIGHNETTEASDSDASAPSSRTSNTASTATSGALPASSGPVAAAPSAAAPSSSGPVAVASAGPGPVAVASGGSGPIAAAPSVVEVASSSPLSIEQRGSTAVDNVPAGRGPAVLTDPTEVMTPPNQPPMASSMAASSLEPTEAIPQATTTSRSGRWPWLAVGLTVFALGSAATWWTMRGDQAPAIEATPAPMSSAQQAAPTVAVAAGDEEASSSQSARSGDPEPEPLEIPTEDAVASSSTTPTDEPAPSEAVDGNGDEGSTIGAASATEMDEQSSTAADDATADESKTRTKAKVLSALSIAASTEVGTIEVKLRSKDGSVRKRSKFSGLKSIGRLPVGKYSITWSRSGSGTSSRSGFVLRKGCDLRLIITPTNMTPKYLGTCK